MASVQQAQGVAQFTDKEKAAIQKTMKEAQNFVANNDNAKARQEQVVVAAGVMMNAQHRTIMLDNKSHEWKGHFIINPPKIIGAETISDGFVHEGANWQGQLPVVVGSKAAIVYATMDRMYPGLGYLLAWDKPENPANGNSKVYVEAGNSAKFAKMDWNEIEAKLNASGNTSHCVDDETGATAAAEIKDFGNLAVMGATFDRRNA